jgi:tRNA pseudouridine38-40 synthase
MPRYKLVLEYDGTGYAGWQRQDNGRSVQGAVEQAVFGFCGEHVNVTGAGRTDAGVHALAQTAHFDLSRAASPHTIRGALNDHLRRNSDGARRIVVVEAEAVADDFHARFSATGRRYLFRIVNRPAPLALDRERAWHVMPPLDLDAMNRAAERLIGRHDFTTFRSMQCQSPNPVKTLEVLRATRSGEEIRIEAGARSFLHNQVRSMVGTLVQVGQGKWTADDVSAALAARDRTACGPTAPPHGLYLAEVRYGKRARGVAAARPEPGTT